MSSTPKSKYATAKGLATRPLPPLPISPAKELELRNVTVFERTQYTLGCRLLSGVNLMTSQKSGVRYISCHLVDVSAYHMLLFFTIQVEDETCIARLVAFNDDAIRLQQDMVEGARLKFHNLQWTPANKQFQGACTCPVEFRAQKDSTVEVCEWIEGPADVRIPPPTSIPSSVPSYVSEMFYFIVSLSRVNISDILAHRVADGQYQLQALVDTVSLLFSGTGKCFVLFTRFHHCSIRSFHAQKRRDTCVFPKKDVSWS